MSPRAESISPKGIGVYAIYILQAKTPLAHLATGLAKCTYLRHGPIMVTP